MTTPIDSIDNPTPWYKSKTQLLQIAQSLIGIGLAVGVISPSVGAMINANLEAVVGIVVTILGAITFFAHPVEVRSAAQATAKETAESIVESGKIGGPGAATAAAKKIVKEQTPKT